MEAAITSVLEGHLPRIRRALEDHGFVQAGEVADRHGALQLTFIKLVKKVSRLVLLNEAVGTGEDDYRGSVDVVAQADDRFVRRRIFASNSRDAFEREVTGDAIETAAAVANSLNEKDLAESFALRQMDADESLAHEDVEATSWVELLENGFDEEELRTYVDRISGSDSAEELAQSLKIPVRRVLYLRRKLGTWRAARH